jgi:hypothetical protein
LPLLVSATSHRPVVVQALRGVGQVAVVLSEDFNPEALLDGVSFTNPLDPAFDLATLGKKLIEGATQGHRTRRRKDGYDRMTDTTRLPDAGGLAIIVHRM